MVRKFVTGSRIRVNIGACGFTGAASFVGLMRPERTGGENSWCSAVDSGKTNGAKFYDCIAKTGGKLAIYKEGTYSEGITTVGLDNTWLLFGLTKAAGTVAIQSYVYNFATKELTESAGGIAITNAEANVGGFLQFGQWNEADQLRATYAAAAAWNKVISKAEFEFLAQVAELQSWLTKTPSGMWFFNQNEGDEVKDLTANGANQAELVGTEFINEEPPIPYVITNAIALPAANRLSRGLILR